MLGFDSLPSKNVLYNGAKSKKIFFTCGIPQGSILGPLFFIAYMKDTFDVFNYLYNILYADDNCIYLLGRELHALINIMNLKPL